MSLNDLLRDQYKSYANIRVNDLICDGDVALSGDVSFPNNSGHATLAAGAVTIPCTNVAASSVILLSFDAAPPANTEPLHVTAITPGVSFAVAATNATTQAISWLVLN